MANAQALQVWVELYQAIKNRRNTYKITVDGLKNITPQALTQEQKVVLENAQRGQLDAEYQMRQFLRTDNDLYSKAQVISTRLQNDTTLDLFHRDQLQRDYNYVSQLASDFTSLRIQNDWADYPLTIYTISSKIYDNIGTTPYWDGSPRGMLHQSQ